MKGQWKEWQPGDPVTVNRIVWDSAEVQQLQDALDNDWFGPGAKVQKFASALSDLTGIDHIQPVNSGSSALELATEAMIHLGHWRPGDWILHPLLTFPTSITPAIRAGLIPCFVDVEMGAYQIDLSQVEQALQLYGDRIKGAIIPHLLGNVCVLDRLVDLLDGRPFIEDCCDTLGSEYRGQHVGNFGEAAAFSFYGSHHATTGGVGGALATHREDIYAYAKSATHWGRNDYDLLADAYERFEKRYWYETLGHDFQLSELQAAFGIVQMARVKGANERRQEVFDDIYSFFHIHRLHDRYFYSPNSPLEANVSWFGYPITIKPDAPFSRQELAMHLMDYRIEIRPIFTGNIICHPAFRPDRTKWVYSGDLVGDGFSLSASNAAIIGDNGLFLPAWGMSEKALTYMLNVLESFFERLEGGVKCHQ